VVIVALGLAAYSNTFDVPFLFDDAGWIVDNPAIRGLWPPTRVGATRPVGAYTLALNWAVHGKSVWGYHATNLAIHLTAGLLLLGIARRTLSRGALGQRFARHAAPLALAIALVWVVHPLQTQAVTYIVQRFESLMGLAFLATLYCFIRAQDSGRPNLWYAASVLCCLAGMGCKEVMVAAPLVMLWYDRAFVAATWREIWARRRWYYGVFAALGVALAAAVLWHHEQHGAGGAVHVEGLTPWTYLLSQTGVIVHYLRLCLWPQGQCFDYGWPTTSSLGDALLPGLVVLGLLGLTVWSAFRWPAWGFLGGWFFLILAPTSSILPIKDLAVEHRMYLPSAAVIAAAIIAGYLVGGAALGRTSGAKAAGVAAIGAIVLGLTVATFVRNQVYESALSVWRDVVAKAPTHARGWMNLGKLLHDEGGTAEAIACAQQGVALAPGDAQAHANLAGIYHECGQFAEAAEQYAKAVEVSNGQIEHRISLMATYVAAGRYEDAVREGRLALASSPQSAGARINLANAELALGRPAEAERLCREVLDSHPNDPGAHALLARIVMPTDPGQALRHMREALRLEPQWPEANLGMGELLAPTRPHEAIGYFEAAIRARPAYAEAHYNLANTCVALRRIDAAIHHLRIAVELKPDWPEARQNLKILEDSAAEAQARGKN
jgi:tetratricopeptide (TPR) repeat protein